MLVAESFVSVQGEGKLTGMPSWFVRLSGCNLRCSWCDTPYASWSPEGAKRSIAELVEEARDSEVRHAVVTGGEPMIFKELPELCARLRETGMHVTIETAGTLYPVEWVDLSCDLMSISPKLANSTPPEGDGRDPGGAWRERHEARRLDFDVLNRLIAGFSEHQLKFVVTGSADLPEIDAVLGRLVGLAPGDVMLMPEGADRPKAELARWAAGVCVERGWRYCHRLHIELFGDTRGT